MSTHDRLGQVNLHCAPQPEFSVQPLPGQHLLVLPVQASPQLYIKEGVKKQANKPCCQTQCVGQRTQVLLRCQGYLRQFVVVPIVVHLPPQHFWPLEQSAAQQTPTEVSLVYHMLGCWASRVQHKSSSHLSRLCRPHNRCYQPCRPCSTCCRRIFSFLHMRVLSFTSGAHNSSTRLQR